MPGRLAECRTESRPLSGRSGRKIGRVRPILLASLLFLAASVAGGESTSDLDRVEELVARLASPVHIERVDARVRLTALGESIHPLLERLAHETLEPEIARAIAEITRSARSLRLVVRKAPDRLILGSDLIVEVALENRSELTYVIAFHSPQAPELVSFHLHAAPEDAAKEDTVVPIQIDGKSPGSITLTPGKTLSLSLRLGGIDNPALGSGPSLLQLVLRVDALWARDPPTPTKGRGRNDRKDWSSVELGLKSGPFTVTWVARPYQELERLLASGTEKERDSAARELHVRDGEEILRLLRRWAKDPLLRLAAVRRLGAAGEERDFDLIRKAANDREIRIKLAAIEALGNFRSASARRQLMLHVDDVGVRTAAIRALSKHKHHATVQCYIRLLKNNVSGGAWVAIVQDTLEAWTGLRVPSRYNEVVSFEKWWEENRSRWIQEQVIGK